MKWKTSYKGYLITSLTTMNEFGRYEARVCIIAMSNSRPITVLLDLYPASAWPAASERLRSEPISASNGSM